MPEASDTFQAGTVHFPGHGDDEIEAYQARPLGDGRYPAVIVVHHMLGYDEPSQEITRKFAAHGYAAVMPNLNWRIAPGASSDDAAAAARAAGGPADEQVVGDIEGAARHLRGLPGSSGQVAVIGYCSGGRQAFLAACLLPLDAVIDCYGAYIVPTEQGGWPVHAEPVIGHVAGLSGPVLGLSGSLDQYPSPDAVTALEQALAAAGQTGEFRVFEGARHGFFATNRPNYAPLAATEGWEMIWDFLGRALRP
jgi:carboxymethylenebutenolidase